MAVEIGIDSLHIIIIELWHNANTFLDNPLIEDYVAVNNNSLLDWCKNKAEGHLQGQCTMWWPSSLYKTYASKEVGSVRV